MTSRMVSRILPATVALVALSAVLCFVAVSMMGSSHTAETVLLGKPVNKRAEWAKCAKMAKSFYGTKPAQRKITPAEKLQAKQCLHMVMMAKKLHAEKKAPVAQTLNQQQQPKCDCCAFAGCPCCQPSIKSGVTSLEHTPAKPHFKEPHLYHPKHPYFHGKGKLMAKFNQKAAKAYKADNPQFKIDFDF